MHERGEWIPERAAERAVGVLDLSLRQRDTNQLVGVLGRRRQQPPFAVGLLRFAALDGEARHEQRQHRKDRDRCEQVSEAFERTKRKRAAQTVVGQRNQPERAKHNPWARRRNGAVFLFGVGLVG